MLEATRLSQPDRRLRPSVTEVVDAIFTRDAVLGARARDLNAQVLTTGVGIITRALVRNAAPFPATFALGAVGPVVARRANAGPVPAYQVLAVVFALVVARTLTVRADFLDTGFSRLAVAPLFTVHCRCKTCWTRLFPRSAGRCLIRSALV